MGSFQQFGCHNSFDLRCDKFLLMRNEHGCPTVGIRTFPQKLGNTASSGVLQQNSIGGAELRAASLLAVKVTLHLIRKQRRCLELLRVL